jgi:hypothetical protein
MNDICGMKVLETIDDVMYLGSVGGCTLDVKGKEN